MHQTVVSTMAARGAHIVVSAPVPLDFALQEGGLSSLQHAFGRLEEEFDPKDHLESLDRVKMNPSTVTEIGIILL